MAIFPHLIFVGLLLVMMAGLVLIAMKLPSPEDTSNMDPGQLRTRTRDWFLGGSFLCLALVVALGQGYTIPEAVGYLAPISLLPVLGVHLWYRRRKASRARQAAVWAFWTLVLTLLITFAGHR